MISTSNSTKKIIFDNIKNDKVIIRCDFNESIKDGVVMSTKRIKANLNTLNTLLARGNTVVLISHHSKEGQSLEPIYNYIKNIYPESEFLKTSDINVLEEYVKINNQLPKILLIENTRLFKKGDVILDKECDEDFTKILAKLGNVFVYDAFSEAHRDHSSTIGLANILPSCLGPCAEEELSRLSLFMGEVSKSIIIMGGAKISTKLPVIKKFLEKDATIFLGGAMVHNILKHNGVDIKDSFYEKDIEVDNILINNNNVILPQEYIWENKNNKERIVDSIIDIKKLNQIIIEKGIKNILWNGPVGICEEGYVEGTVKIYNYILKSNLCTVVGGGDTLTFIENYEKTLHGAFTCTYLSLSGGAMLDFLSGKKLSVIEKLK